MPIRREPHITRQMVRAEPDTLWCFGDNIDRRGMGGQAKEMRGEPNAIGIVTKRLPAMNPAAFFSDNDASLAVFCAVNAATFARLRDHLETGGTVVLPSDGIGTGLADLERRAPRIWASLQRAIAKLEAIEPNMEKPGLQPRLPVEFCSSPREATEVFERKDRTTAAPAVNTPSPNLKRGPNPLLLRGRVGEAWVWFSV